MKKLLLTLALIGIFSGVTACGNRNSSRNSAETSDSNNTISGEVDEIKDYMFVLETGSDRSYAFPIENGYLELRGIREDDWVTITYSGELSEVRAFDGELISVEKIR